MTIRITNNTSIEEDDDFSIHIYDLGLDFDTVRSYTLGNKDKLVFTIKMSTNIERRFVLNYKNNKLQTVTYTDLFSEYPECNMGKYIYIRSFWSRMVHTQGYIY